MLTHLQGVCYTRTSLMPLILLLSLVLSAFSTLIALPIRSPSQLTSRPEVTIDLPHVSDVPTSTPEVPPVLEPLPVSREQYEAALNRPAVNSLDSLASTTYLGLEIHWKEFDAFFPYVTLGLALPEVPEIERVREANTFTRTARLTIARVLNRAGKDVYDKKSSFEESPFDGLDFQPIQELPGYAEAERQVHVQKGVKEADIHSIEGQVILDLPVNVRPIEFTPSEVGMTKTQASSTVSLIAVNDSEYEFQFTGDARNFIRFFGYDATGRRVPIASHTADFAEVQEHTAPLFVTFSEPVARVKMFIAEDILTKTYPFHLVVGK